VQFSKFRSCKLVCAPASPAALFLCSTARIRQDISVDSFCSCKLLWRNNECVLLPCFNAQPDIFAVMNCCDVVLCLFFSDSLTWSADNLYCYDTKISGVDVEKYAYYVNKLRQNVGLETWKRRRIVTSQRAHTKYKCPPYDPERTPPWKFSAYATDWTQDAVSEWRCHWLSEQKYWLFYCFRMFAYIRKFSRNTNISY